nr:CHAP domain-containing protein [Limobrevibacterium gyesilva]
MTLGNPTPAHAARPNDTANRTQATHKASTAQPGRAAAPRASTAPAHLSSKKPQSKTGKVVYARHSYGGISCVPYARAASGIDLKGNAVNWWDAAAGVYQRGSQPEPGSVLNFRATGSMRLGHVAVVTRVINAREVEIDHANWARTGKGNVARGIAVIDVSDNNDWSAVRVSLGRNGDFGSVYPTYGFIYDRPDRGVMLANSRARRTPSRAASYDEVAEAPAVAGEIDAVNRNIR